MCDNYCNFEYKFDELRQLIFSEIRQLRNDMEEMLDFIQYKINKGK